MKNIMPPYYFFGGIALELILHFLVPLYKYDISPYHWIGLAISVIGILLNLEAKKIVLKNNSTIIPFQRPHLLIKHGPFLYSRNPMYLGMLVVLLGEAILLSSLSTLIVPILFGTIITIKFIRPEERILERTFGENFENYKNKVRRWI